MTKRTVQMATAALPKQKPEPCPVASLAREFKDLNDSFNELEQKSFSLAGEAHQENSKRMAALEAHRNWIEERVSHELALSGLGAIFQIALLLENAHELEGIAWEAGKNAERAAVVLESVNRMAYSLVAFIETATGAKREDASGDYYLPDRLNPHLKLADALAAA